MENLVKYKEQEQLILSQAKQIDEIEKVNEDNKQKERTKLKNQLKQEIINQKLNFQIKNKIQKDETLNEENAIVRNDQDAKQVYDNHQKMAKMVAQKRFKQTLIQQVIDKKQL